MSTTTLHLAKQNFKFSAAHFLIFDEKNAERLHGHNYQVRVDIRTPDQASSYKEGYFIDFNVFKRFIKQRLDIWDERVLLPGKHPDMKIQKTAQGCEVNFRDRYYVFPQKEVEVLPVTNTSVEQLSALLAEDFYQEFRQYGVVQLRVYVAETPGQGASTVVGKRA
ncbi:MAG: 6-carboxytetrahydropterin synthase [Bdellovibrio sp.]